MTINTIIGIAAAVALLAGCIVLACLYIKHRTKEEIRTDVYQLILRAENAFLYGQNTQKFEHVVQLARSLLPQPLQTIITVPVLQTIFRKLIQELFDEIKDVMDDGKRNGSVKEEENGNTETV